MCAQIVSLAGIQAEIPEAVGREATAITCAAKGLANRSDDANPCSILQPKARGRRRALYTIGRDGSVVLFELCEDFAPVNNLILRPVGGSADVHILDKANLCTEALAVFNEVDQLVVVKVSYYNGVDLDRIKGGDRRIDSSQHAVEGIAAC